MVVCLLSLFAKCAHRVAKIAGSSTSVSASRQTVTGCCCCWCLTAAHFETLRKRGSWSSTDAATSAPAKWPPHDRHCPPSIFLSFFLSVPLSATVCPIVMSTNKWGQKERCQALFSLDDTLEYKVCSDYCLSAVTLSSSSSHITLLWYHFVIDWTCFNCPSELSNITAPLLVCHFQWLAEKKRLHQQ